MKGIQNINLSNCPKITNKTLAYLRKVISIDLTESLITGNGLKYLTNCLDITLKKLNTAIKDDGFITSISANIITLNISKVDIGRIRKDSFSHLVNLTNLTITNSYIGYTSLSYFTNLRNL